MRVALVALCLAMPAVHPAGAQATRENGFEVSRSETAHPAPHGRVGRKFTAREARVGYTEETYGDSSSAVITLGGFVDQCPSGAGKVPGDFEFSVSSEQVTADDSGVQRTRHQKRVNARTEAMVQDDGTVAEIVMDYEFTEDKDGARISSGPRSVGFKMAAGGQPNTAALTDVITVTQDLAVTALMWQVAIAYSLSQFEWLKEKTLASNMPSTRRATKGVSLRTSPSRSARRCAPRRASSRSARAKRTPVC